MKKTLTIMFIAIILFAMITTMGCNRSTPGPDKTPKSTAGPTKVDASPSPDTKKPSPSPDGDKPLSGAGKASKEDLQKLVDDNNTFAMDLYRELVIKDENGFFSPYSISSALAMTYNGAKGRTKKQMADVMHFNMPLDKFNPAFASVIDSLNQAGKKGIYKLHTANRLFGEKTYKFSDDFLNTLKDYYNASLEQMDFMNNWEPARTAINQWVEKKTNNKIKNLLPKGSITDLTRLVLVNAIYFKGDWKHQFKEEMTKKQDFNLTADKTKKVDMMHQSRKFKYNKVDDVGVLELPYKKDELSMLIFLPDKLDGIHELDKKMTTGFYKKALKGLKSHTVNLKMPKFKMTQNYDLVKKFAAMGMTDAFKEGVADFTGMTGRPEKELYISKIIHKAFIAVDEEGTEAAAATAVVVTRTTAARPMPKIVPFIVDHPFVIIIKDNKTGSILFMGRIMDPESKLGK